jgi:signal recognition particle subunit SRP54
LFERLAERLDAVWKRLRGHGVLTEKDLDEALREVRIALLEADVGFRVVRDFVARVRERALGQEVLQSLTPGQTVVKIVHEELTALMGGGQARLAAAPVPPTVILLVGLQGSGKTTTAAKLALHLLRQGRQPLLVAADLARPAAVEQLAILARQAGVPVVVPEPGEGPVEVAARGVERGRSLGRDPVIVDSAGRLHIDADLMEELRQVRARCRAHEVLLVVDSMTGQDAVNVAQGFSDGLGVDGVVLTKLDGDARGGAALSVRAVTGRPVKFVGVGEKLEALEPFHPERMASRILGMGDVLTLIERAQATIDQGQARAMEERLRKQTLSLDDFLEQLQAVRRLGPLDNLMQLIPGVGAARRLRGAQVDEAELTHVEAIIRSMTAEERRRPEIVDGSRKRRIALGSGTRVQDVNRLLRQFDEMRRLMRGLARGRQPGVPGGLPMGPRGRGRR